MDNIYVTLPPELVAINFPGYFFHVVEQRLYSLKSGELKQLHRCTGNQWNDFQPGYRISHNGVKKYMREDFLINRTKQPKLTVIPYHVPTKQCKSINGIGENHPNGVEQVNQPI